MDKDSILDSFVIYRDYHDSLKNLPIEQYGRLMHAILEKGLYGIDPEFDNAVESALWTAFKVGIEHSRSISIARREANALRKARKGGAPFNNNNASKQQEERQTESETTTKQQQNNNKTTTKGERRKEKGEIFSDSSLHSESLSFARAFDDAKQQQSNNDEKRSVFVKPKIEDVDAYIRERGYHFDAETFYNFYESKGWMVGSNHMKDWKAACRTWEAKRKNEAKPSSDEEAAVQEFPAGLTQEKWNATMTWAKRHIPRIWDKFSPSEFLSMKAMAQHKSSVFTEIICAIDKSDYTGDITKEFRRLACEEPYVSKILGNG